MNRTLHGTPQEGGWPTMGGGDEGDSASGASLITVADKRPMRFWHMWAHVLPHSPRAALAAMYWQLTKRRVRARNRLAGAAALLPYAYDVWMRQTEQPATLVELARTRPRQWSRQPRFLVLVIRGSASDEEVEATLQSIEQQFYGASRVGWVASSDVVKAADGDAGRLTDAARAEVQLADAIVTAGEEYIVLVGGGDLLAPGALLRLAEAVQGEDPPLVVYGDHDEINSHGQRRRPWFKPSWNAEMFLGLDFVSPVVAVDAELASQAVREASDRRAAEYDDFLLAATNLAAERVLHIPHVLCHVPGDRPEPPAEQRLLAVNSHLQGTGASAAPGPFNTIRVSWPLPAALPLVSIIVPTRDKVELLRPCVESLLERTSYRNFELIVVDNRSEEPETAAYLTKLSKHAQVQVLDYDRDYNFAAINNFAARQANGDYLCMLNNDTEVVDASWLSELMRYAVRPEIGAVGAKLLYPDGKIQHAGVVVGLGGAAGHAHRFDPSDGPGYFRQAHVAQFVSAVTAACLVVRKDKFDAVGGLDEEGFAVAFNDVDFCLKLLRAGWRNVYTPHAVLIHHESKSRGKDYSPANLPRFTRELALLQQRWATETVQDPFHNPNLDRRSERFIIDL